MLALVLLTVEPTLTGVWRWCSGVAFVVFLLFGITTMTGFRRLDLQQLQGAPANFIFIYLRPSVLEPRSCNCITSPWSVRFSRSSLGSIFNLSRRCSNSRG